MKQKIRLLLGIMACFALMFLVNVDAKAAGYNFSDCTAKSTNLRHPEKNVEFVGNTGKYHMIVFGGVVRCGNTKSALQSINKCTESMDMSKVDILVYDVQGADTSDILDMIDTLGMSDAIQFGKFTYSAVNSLYSRCLSVAGVSGSYTLPLIVFLNQQDDVIYTSTNYVASKTLENLFVKENLMQAMPKGPSYYVTGNSLYGYAYEVLDILNAERAKEGLSALKMDEGLLDAAMRRAAECSLYYDHDRPDGSDCFDLNEKMYAENIAAGHRSPEAVMTGWMNSSGHRKNILNASYNSIGIGVFYTNGKYYWAQNFGRGSIETPGNHEDTIRTYLIETDVNIVNTPTISNTQLSLEAGESKAVQKPLILNAGWTYSSTYVDLESYHWTSSNTRVAKVDEKGVVTAVGGGEAIVTGKNIAYPNLYVEYTVTVSGDPAPDEDPGKDDNTPEKYALVYNADDYYARNPDVAAAFGKNEAALWEHFMTWGMKEGRVAKADFDVRVYRSKYGDLSGAFGDDWKLYYVHYIQFGHGEGRTGVADQVPQGPSPADYADVYDLNYYCQVNPDVAVAFGGDAAKTFEHFMTYGMKEGRVACANFDVQIYRAKYGDLQAAFGTDMTRYYKHYIEFGKNEGRVGK